MAAMVQHAGPSYNEQCTQLHAEPGKRTHSALQWLRPLSDLVVNAFGHPENSQRKLAGIPLMERLGQGPGHYGYPGIDLLDLDQLEDTERADNP